MSDHKLLVSDADIDIARLIVKLDRLDGRESDPATLRVAGAAAFDAGDPEDSQYGDSPYEDSQYEAADDVARTVLVVPVNGTRLGPAEAIKPVRLRSLVRRRPRARIRVSPATRSLPAL